MYIARRRDSPLSKAGLRLLQEIRADVQPRSDGCQAVEEDSDAPAELLNRLSLSGSSVTEAVRSTRSSRCISAEIASKDGNSLATSRSGFIRLPCVAPLARLVSEAIWITPLSESERLHVPDAPGSNSELRSSIDTASVCGPRPRRIKDELGIALTLASQVPAPVRKPSVQRPSTCERAT